MPVSTFGAHPDMVKLMTRVRKVGGDVTRSGSGHLHWSLPDQGPTIVTGLTDSVGGRNLSMRMIIRRLRPLEKAAKGDRMLETRLERNRLDGRIAAEQKAAAALEEQRQRELAERKRQARIAEQRRVQAAQRRWSLGDARQLLRDGYGLDVVMRRTGYPKDMLYDAWLDTQRALSR